jgi:hypothetical protein
MKKITVLIAIIFPAVMLAQSVSINADATAPDSSAMLDIKSDSKGLLMPRLTTLQRTSIAGPALGLTVFDKNTYSYWIYRGDINGGWVELLNSLDKHWNKTDIHVFNTNSGNVGIGTNTPASKLTINDINPVIGMLNNGLAVGHIQADGFDMKIGTHPDNPVGDIIFQPKGIDRVTITETGKLGIGTSAPTALLSINSSNNEPPGLDLYENNVRKSYMNSGTNNLILGTDFDNATGTIRFQTRGADRMTINPSGYVGIGTNTPSSELTVNSSVNTAIQLQRFGSNRGFVKLENNDMILGPISLGALRVSTNGINRMYVDNNGNVGIGTTESTSTFLTIGENGIGRSGVTFLGTINNTERGNLFFTNSGGTFNCYEGDFTIRTNGIGFKLFEDGNFAMGGTTKATNYRLSVHGKIIGTEVTAMAIANWPDYVFSDNYKLKPLAEVKNFIAVNKHLPNIPAASEIEKNGIPLGDMSKRLMEKVEELTLYIIGMQEQIDALKKNK